MPKKKNYQNLSKSMAKEIEENLKKINFQYMGKFNFKDEEDFCSVIPFWGIDKATSKRILHSGDIENDQITKKYRFCGIFQWHLVTAWIQP